MEPPALVKSKSTDLSPAQAAERYADEYWTARGYCIEYTSNKSVLFHPASNNTISTDIIQDDFTKWAAINHINVVSDNYGAFLSSLVVRVRPYMRKVYGCGFRPIADRFYVDSNGVPLANTFIPFTPAPQVDTTPSSSTCAQLASRPPTNE
jgi:hypothetical protein